MAVRKTAAQKREEQMAAHKAEVTATLEQFMKERHKRLLELLLKASSENLEIEISRVSNEENYRIKITGTAESWKYPDNEVFVHFEKDSDVTYEYYCSFVFEFERCVDDMIQRSKEKREEAQRIANLKASALGKLSPEERKVLGV